jgi:hypothetical protein
VGLLGRFIRGYGYQVFMMCDMKESYILGGVCFGLYSRLMAYMVLGLCFITSLFVDYFYRAEKFQNEPQKVRYYIFQFIAG